MLQIRYRSGQYLACSRSAWKTVQCAHTSPDREGAPDPGKVRFTCRKLRHMMPIWTCLGMIAPNRAHFGTVWGHILGDQMGSLWHLGGAVARCHEVAPNRAQKNDRNGAGTLDDVAYFPHLNGQKGAKKGG